MTCAQGLLRLLWGGPKLECYGTAQLYYQIVGLCYLTSDGLFRIRITWNNRVHNSFVSSLPYHVEQLDASLLFRRFSL